MSDLPVKNPKKCYWQQKSRLPHIGVFFYLFNPSLKTDNTSRLITFQLESLDRALALLSRLRSIIIIIIIIIIISSFDRRGVVSSPDLTTDGSLPSSSVHNAQIMQQHCNKPEPTDSKYWLLAGHVESLDSLFFMSLRHTKELRWPAVTCIDAV